MERIRVDPDGNPGYPRGYVPQPDCPIKTPADQGPAVRRKGHGMNPGSIPVEGAPLLSSSDVPQLDRVVIDSSAGGQRLAVRRKGDGGAELVPVLDGPILAGLQIPHPHRHGALIVPGPRGQGLAARREGNRRHIFAVTPFEGS